MMGNANKESSNKKRIVVWLIACTIILIIIAGFNMLWGFINVPVPGKVVDREISYVTISTVFIGFAFTALGIIFGMSSEKLIENVQGTTGIQDKVSNIVLSIVFLFFSIFVAVFFLLGINDFIIKKCSEVAYAIHSILYVLGMGYLVAGIISFAASAYDLYKLTVQIYTYNRHEAVKKIKDAKQEMQNNDKRLKTANFDE